MGLLPHDMEILPPSDDRIFKLPDSKPVLVDLIRAVICRDVVNAEVRNNELPPEDVHEKAERLDVNCRLADGTQVDLEMQANAIEEDPGEDEGDEQRHLNLKGKSVYYLCDLHSSQSAKGLKRYDRLARSYQVTFCSYTVFPQRSGYCNSFSLRHDEDNGLLCDAIHIIFVELSKLQKILNKSVEEMTDLEKWAIFFRYADSERSREKVNEVIASKEELQMAGEMLMSISKDERECAVFRSRRMYQTDLMSNLATAEDRGLRRGVEIGKREGIGIGRREGRREGAHDAMIIFARRLLAQNHSVEEIMDYTELSREEIEKLRSDSE